MDLNTDKISIIIPTYNEEKSIDKLLKHLQEFTEGFETEIVVVDGKSTDKTESLVKSYGVQFIVSEKKGRASQMNLGAAHTDGDILYFVHADSFPPASFVNDIYKSLDLGYDSGCYRFKFDSEKLLLKINSYFTRYDRLMCRGGDQTLFVKRSVFEGLGGFKDHYLIMEDFDFINLLRKKYSFRIIPKNVVVSARKYENNAYLKVNFVNLIIFLMYFSGASQQTLVHAYKELIKRTRFG